MLFMVGSSSHKFINIAFTNNIMIFLFGQVSRSTATGCRHPAVFSGCRRHGDLSFQITEPPRKISMILSESGASTSFSRVTGSIRFNAWPELKWSNLYRGWMVVQEHDLFRNMCSDLWLNPLLPCKWQLPWHNFSEPAANLYTDNSKAKGHW